MKRWSDIHLLSGEKKRLGATDVRDT